MGDKPWHSRKKPCHKCEKETKLALKCEHCGAMQQWDASDQMFFFKSLSSKWKALYAVGLIVVCYLSFTVSYSFFSVDDSGVSSKSSSSRSSSSSSSSYSKPKKTCQDAYGNWRTYSLRCYTCGTSYCSDRSSLAYGKYCSQSCCAAYEGISSKCGY